MVRRLAAINQAARAMNSILDPDKLLDTILSLVEDVFSLDTCAILLFDPERNALTIQAARGYRPEVVEHFRAEPGQGITGHVFATGDPIIVSDVSEWNGYVEGVAGARSEMAAPLRLDDEVIGVLDAESRHPGAFHQIDLELFRIFANQAATAINNARLVDRLEQRSRQLEKTVNELALLDRLGKQMNANLSLDSLLHEVLNLAQKALHFDQCAVLLKEHQKDVGEVLILRSAVGYRDKVQAGMFIRAGEGITGRVLATGQPILVPDVRDDGHYIEGVAGGRCEMAAPLIVRGEVMGVLDAEAKQPDAFSEDDLRLFSTFASWAAQALHNAEIYSNLERLLEHTQQTYYETIRSLAQALEARDAYTRGHSERVTRYALVVADRMDLSENSRKLLRYAGLLHDIGKIGISDTILHKRFELSDEEWDTIRNHPMFGDTILGPIKFLADAGKIVLHHHERYDGSGYPDKLKGEEIPLEARVIAVADSFDAMTSDRPYRKAMKREKAISEIRQESGKQFDPRVVDAFLAAIG